MHLETNAIVTDNVSFFPKAAVSVERKMMEIRLMWLESPAIAGEAKPGQFVMVRCGDLSLPRPLSIHRIKNGSLAILFAVLRDGKGTRWLSERKPDDRVQLLGPLGNGFRIDSTSSTLLLVAGGMGIAPLYFLANQAVSKHFNVTLLIGAHTGQLLYPRHLMPVGIHVFAATDDGSDGQTGMVTSLISRHAERADQLFVCGPLAMYREMSINKNRLGLEGKPVQVSIEATMGCGHGVCYGCTVATRQGLRQVCKDGPVFELGDLSLTDLS